VRARIYNHFNTENSKKGKVKLQEFGGAKGHSGESTHSHQCALGSVNIVFGLCKEFIVKEFVVASYMPNRKLKL